VTLIYDAQAAMFDWFDVTGKTTDTLNSIRRQLQNQTGPQNFTQKSALDFLLNVFPCDFSISPTESDKAERTERLGRLIKQFYFLGPVGERFFHWMFLLGASDKKIVWKDSKEPRSFVKCLEPCQKFEAGVKAGNHTWDVPFWRALAQIRDSLILHLNDQSEALKGKPTGLYPDSRGPTITEERGSDIFTIEKIYTHAKDTFTFSFLDADPKKTADEMSAAQISNIRGQLEFEWLITRPYSPVWRSKHAPTPDNLSTHSSGALNDPGDQRLDASRAAGDEPGHVLPAKGGSNGSPAQVEMSSLSSSSGINPSKKKRSGSVGELSLNEILGVSSLSDIDITAKEQNYNWDWNESMWQSVSKSVEDGESPGAGSARKSIFFERANDYVDQYTGENLFHL
jgi:hypothetical protein